MNQTSSQEQGRRGWRISLAMLAASAALVGVAYGLAPAPASAMVNDGNVCGPFEASWFSCIVNDDDDTGGDGGGGGDSEGTKTVGNSDGGLIEINVVKVKVPLGTRKDSPETGGDEPDVSRGEGSNKTNQNKYIPRCKNGRTTNCRMPNIVCVINDGTDYGLRVDVYNFKECDEAREKYEKEQKEKEKQRQSEQGNRREIRRQNCNHYRLKVEAANEKLQGWSDALQKGGNWEQVQDHEDVKDTIAGYVDAFREMNSLHCDDFFNDSPEDEYPTLRQRS